MSIQPELQKEKAASGDTSECIPKQVRLAAWLAVLGAAVTAGTASATTIWPVAAASMSVALMMAVVCYAIVKYR
jgi:hypothetical protein